METQHTLSTKQRFSAAMTTCSIISAMLVVWIHTYNIEVYGSENRVLYWVQEAISQGIARGAVPFFLMSSAFFLYSKTKTVSEVYRSRSRSVLVPYLLWNTVYMIAFAVLRHLSLTNTGMDTITVENVALGLFWHKYNYAYWFMRDLIIMVALYPLIRWILSRGKVVSFLVLGALIVTICFDATFLKSSFYYCVGAIIGYHYSHWAEKAVTMKAKTHWIIIVALLAASTALFCVWYINEPLIIAVIRDLLIAFLWFFVVVRCHIRIGGAFAALSFMIYSLHPLLLEVVEKIIYRLFPHSDMWMMIDYVVAPILCIALIVGICWVWKKVLPKMYCLFNGGRL